MRLTDEQLLSLSAWIKESRSDEGYIKALVGERCIGLNTLQAPIRDIVNQTESGKGFFLTLVPRKILGLHDRDTMEYIGLMQEYIDAMELPSNERLLVCEPIHEDVHSGKRGGLLTRLLRPAFRRIMMQIDTSCTAHALATQTAIAVERYRLTEGRPPQSLDNLIPAYLESVPKDPFDGRNLRYITRETGFVVYSINDDLTDNGGAEPDSQKRDSKGKPLPWDVTFIVER
jgi:hypothetical protein